jgi:hypothetical protein
VNEVIDPYMTGNNDFHETEIPSLGKYDGQENNDLKIYMIEIISSKYPRIIIYEEKLKKMSF